MKPTSPTPSNTGSARSFQRDTERGIKVLRYCMVLQRGCTVVYQCATRAHQTCTGTYSPGRAPLRGWIGLHLILYSIHSTATDRRWAMAHSNTPNVTLSQQCHTQQWVALTATHWQTRVSCVGVPKLAHFRWNPDKDQVEMQYHDLSILLIQCQPRKIQTSSSVVGDTDRYLPFVSGYWPYPLVNRLCPHIYKNSRCRLNVGCNWKNLVL